MQQLFLKLFNLSLSAGILILIVLIFRKLFVKAPKWIICLLWGIVAVRLICPFSLESALSLAPRAEVVRMDNTVTRPVIQSGFDSIDARINTYVENLYVTEPMQNPPETIDEVITVRRQPIDVVGILSKVWLVGVFLLSGYGLFSYVKVYQSVRFSAKSERNVYICDDINMPFILGLIKPKIYLPSTLTEPEKANIVAHEQAHIQRGDFLWKPLGYLLLSVYWFQPLVWVAYIFLCKDIEMACDEKVVAKMTTEQRKLYSMVLLSFSMPNKMITACPLAFGEVGVKKRVKGVLNYRKPAFWVILLAIVTCVVVTICFLTNSKGEEGNTTLPKLTEKQLRTLHQQEFDKHTDKLLDPVQFEFVSLSYDGRIYTAGRNDRGIFVYPEDVPGDGFDESLADYPLEKICDVYGALFVKPVYGDLNADGKYSDVYAWYDDPRKVKGEVKQGTIWKLEGYETKNQVVLTIPHINDNGITKYEMIHFCCLNGVNIETGEDLMNIVLKPEHADRYTVAGKLNTIHNLSGDNPEEKYFISDFVKASVVSANEIKNKEHYETILIHEREPYRRFIYLRDYGDGIVGYHTPEGTEVYFRVWEVAKEAEEDEKNIDFEYFFRGFKPLGPDYEYMDELYDGNVGGLIYSKEDWLDFAEKFCPIATAIATPDFRQKCFYVTYGLYGSRASANLSHDITSIEVVDNHIYTNSAEHDFAWPVYIENSHATGHLFMNVLVLNRSDIPENVGNIIYTRTGENEASAEVLSKEKEAAEQGKKEQTGIPVNAASSQGNKESVDFDYFFRGFTPLWQDYKYTDEMYEILGGCLIYSEEDWIDFKHKFCTAAGPYTTPDFNEKCFLALPSLYGSRPSANSSFVVDSVEVVKNGLSVQIAESTPENTIYVENVNGVGHLFVNVIVLNRSDIPENVDRKIYTRTVKEQ